MREILFRAKREATNEWVYGYFVNEYDDFQIYVQPQIITRSGREYVNENTLGQFTGLTDKNGVKIFEGDIVRYGDTIHKVVFEQRNGTAYFGLVYSPIETLPFGHYQDLQQLEVIGNIYDNPELIGGADDENT